MAIEFIEDNVSVDGKGSIELFFVLFTLIIGPLICVLLCLILPSED